MARREVKVRQYKDAQEYERDANKMLAGGWDILQQSETGTHLNFGRTAFSTLATGGLNLLVPKIGGGSYTKGKITVTWVRER